MRCFAGMLQDENAASSVEYSILLAGIALIVAASITALGQAVRNLYHQAASLFP